MPTTLPARSGKTNSNVRPKKTPVPTDVNPTMNPPNNPMRHGSNLVARREDEGVSHRDPFLEDVLHEQARPAEEEGAAEQPGLLRRDAGVASPSFEAAATPTSAVGAEPMNIQPLSRPWTVPSRLWRSAPTLLKTAPWKMSVPIAMTG